MKQIEQIIFKTNDFDNYQEQNSKSMKSLGNNLKKSDHLSYKSVADKKKVSYLYSNNIF